MDAEDQFEELYSRQSAAVRTYVRRRIDSDDADDVVADVFVIAWRRRDDLPEDQLPWLLGVARRVMANRRRSSTREAALRDRIAFERQTEAQPFAANSESSRDVRRALNVMREQDREVLLLIAWEGLTPAQAAQVLGVSTNTFSARLSRARRRFERALSTCSSPDSHTGSAKAQVLP